VPQFSQGSAAQNAAHEITFRQRWLSKTAMTIGAAAAVLLFSGYSLAGNPVRPEPGGTVARDQAATDQPAGTTKTNPKDGLIYVWIPPGSFVMGCVPGDKECGEDEKPAHKVTITKGFWMGQTPVPQAAYQKVIGDNPSGFPGEKRPVENITWAQANAYCEAVAMRLPTEAEFEYAARAGETGIRYGDIDAIAWYQKNSGKQSHDVGTKQPNAWKLYDVLGNVLQWTGDWFHHYDPDELTDPHGPPASSKTPLKALRGGGWGFQPRFVRLSARSGAIPPDRHFNYVGVRCVGE
jgi:formylglycine-generating enzyme required for sulfatase activity